MLKKIFKRNKKGLKRTKKSKSKSKKNKMNISTGNLDTNTNTLSFIESGPNAEDEEDDEIDLPKLNFTCILNNPLEETNNTSILGQLLMRFQEDQRIVTEEERIRKEGYKFDLIDIIQDIKPEKKNSTIKNSLNNSAIIENKIKAKLDGDGEEEEEELDDILNDLEELENIFSPKKSLEQCIKETNEELYKDKKTFKLKKFVELSYNNYIAKIKHEYLIHRDNHKKNIMEKLDLEDVLNCEIKIGTKEEILNTVNNYRKNLNNSMALIDKEFKIDTNEYKIKDDLLNMDINQILEINMKLIEQKGIVELEAEKSNVNYNIIRYFFKNNYPLLINEVDNAQFKITALIEKKDEIKNKFLEASKKLVLMKLKRQNLLKLNNIYKKMLEANCDKIENINTIPKIREMKKKLKNIPNYGLNIIKKINDELESRETNINSENVNKITVLIKNEISNCFDIETYTNEDEEEEEDDDENDPENISPKKKYNYKYYNIDEKLFKQILKYKNNIENNTKETIYLIINSIDEEFIKEKIYSLLDLAEDKSDFMEKVSNVLVSSISQAILTTLGKILPLKNMNEILYLFYIGKMGQVLLDTINKMINDEDKEKLITSITNNLFDIMEKNLSFIVNDSSNYSQNIDKFIIKNKILKEVCSQISLFISNKNFYSKVEKYELDFIDNFGKGRREKIKDELNLDNLRNINNFSYEYQKLANIIFSFNSESLNQDEDKKYDNLKNHILLDIELDVKINEPKEINLIEIPVVSEGKDNKKKCKLMTTSLDLITDTIFSIKMLLFFNKNNYNKILTYLYEIFDNFIKLNNYIVLEKKGQIKNITQNELASSYSTVYLIRKITSNLISFIESSKDISEEVNKKFKDLEASSKDYLDKNLDKLTNMIKEGIDEASLEEFKKIITAEKYPTVKDKLPINPFAQSLVKLVGGVNKSLKNCYEDRTISKIILDNLNNFNNEAEKLIENKKELNDEEKKQFKKDFLFIKKNIDNGIEDIDFKSFKKKLTAAYKKLLPKDKGD